MWTLWSCGPSLHQWGLSRGSARRIIVESDAHPASGSLFVYLFITGSIYVFVCATDSSRAREQPARQHCKPGLL